MTLYRSNPPTAALGATNDGPITLGVQFKVTDTGCTLNGFRFYQGLNAWSGTVTAALYAVGGSTPLTTAITIDTTSAGIASSEPVGSSFGAMMALDGDSGTRWLGTKPTTGTPQWLRVLCDAATVVTEYKVTPHPGSSAYDPKDFKLQGSNDGFTTPVDLDTRTGITYSGQAERTFTFSNSTAYLSYRILITDNGGASDYVAITQFTLTGVTLPTWREAFLTTPYALTSGTDYRAAIYFPAYRTTANGSISSDLVSGPLTVPSHAHATNGNHTYITGSGMQNPTNAANSNYMVDVIVEQASATIVAAPLITATSDMLDPAVTTTTVVAAPLLAAASDMLDPTVTATSGATSVDAPLLAGSSDMLDPTVSIVSNITVDTPVLTATSDMLDPTVTAGTNVSVSAPVLTGVSDMLDPTVVTVSDNITLAFSAGPSLTLTTSTITLDLITVPFSAGASLTLATPLDVDLVSMDFAAGARFDVVIPRDHTVDPVTGLPQYRLRVVEPDGTGVTELPKATIGDIVEELNDDGSLDFTLPKYDATSAFVTPRRGEPIPEVQVWRGPNLEAWQKVDGANPDGQTVAFDCSGLMGYLKGRVIGKAPKRNLLVNPNFTDGLAHWTGGYLPGSIPASVPKASVVSVDFFGETRKALQITGADTVTTVKSSVETAAVFVPNSSSLLPGGAAVLTAAANAIPDGANPIHIVGHTANDGTGSGLTLSLNRAIAAKPYVASANPSATISILPGLKSPNATGSGVAGRGYYEPVASNATEAGRKQNRRVEFSYKATVTAGAQHQQYFGQDISFTNTTGREVTITVDGYFKVVTFLGVSGNSYGVQVQLVKAATPTKEVEESHSTIDENTPVGEWISHEASVTIPPNGQAYILHVRYFPPEGLVQWTELGVWPDDALFFPTGTDQALIAKGLVEHAQDDAMDKEGDWPILIGTRTPLTGIKRRREYLYHERRYVSTCLEDLQALYRGMDMHIETDATTRTLVTSYPRRGQRTQVTLSLGGNVVAYRAPVDVTSVSTRRYVQGLDQSGANRREGVYTDTSGLGGLLVEEVEYAKPDTPVTELDETAISGVKRYGHPSALLEVTIGRIGGGPGAQAELTSWMLDRVKVGDVVNVDVVDGQTNITGLHRVTRKTLTPDTDTLRYLLAPEV